MLITVDKPNLLAALDMIDKNEVRPWMRAVIFDAAGDLVGTDGRMMFVGKHGGVEKDVLVEFPHRPPAKFDTCTIDTDKLLARYVETRTGQTTELSITISEAHKVQWDRAVNGNWTAPKPDHGATTTRINSNMVAKACKALSRFRKDGQIFIQPSASGKEAVKFILEEGPFVMLMCMRKPAAAKAA